MDDNEVSFKGKKYKLDRHGFLDPPDQWDEDFAEGIAGKLGIHGGLTEDHWSFIRYLRNKFIKEKTVPVVVAACADNKLRLSRLRALFPTGYHRGACKIAGINFEFMRDVNIWLTFESIPPQETEHEVDELGFLKDFEKWNERFTHWVVRNWDLPDGVTEEHWKIIHYLRDFYRENMNIPTVYELCKSNDIGLGRLGELFPRGYRRGACRAAGLPFFG
ncbi:MAG: TusE/DsrC/DsvC family sulfur relay protein [Candidatus Zixiibacteriota bacterium]|nr:MAG: TusE/DsrC/DsvC family sulfur relay protein [candidate division Zixibacteria bacterium]